MRVLFSLCVMLLSMTGPRAAHADAPDIVARGEYLARAGDCVVCHTGPGEKPFSGGLKMATPLGAIYTTNITPDKDTGIGNDTFEDFERAMRRGTAKDGHHLYPAMPYPSYAKVSDEDLRALYAFFMQSVKPVARQNSKTEIPWPLNMRWPLAIWDVVFTPKLGYTPNAARDAQWNRGAYLVEGFGHCGACHTPRGIFFQEKALDENGSRYLAGADLDNWFASNLRSGQKLGLADWTGGDIHDFLKTGHNMHATAFGTMIEAINNSTQYLTDDDLDAIAAYLKSLPVDEKAAKTPDVGTRQAADDSAGAKLYAQQCAYCHVNDGRGYAPFLPPLAGNPVATDAVPSSLVNIILNGSARIVVDGMPDTYRMPQFRVQLKDQQVAELASFVRETWGNPEKPVSADDVAKIRKITDPASDAVVILKMK